MPLPAENQSWPPKEWAPIHGQMETWAAWWTGDTTKLRKSYENSSGRNSQGKRFFWNRQNNNPDNRPSRTDLHVPIAADICATNADLIYGVQPSVESEANKPGKPAATTTRIAEYFENGLLDQLLEGAETGAALTGRYHQVVWDPELTNMPFVTTVHADHALPEFKWGRLVAVTFWTVIQRNNSEVYRHVERHELIRGTGFVFHGLYLGTASNLGRRIDLNALTATQGLQVEKDGALIAGRTPELSVVYIPNITPQRRWRTDPLGRNLGRSDLDGLEGMMDALDEVYSSWMRDIRLGKARVFADRALLEQPVVSTRGEAQAFNTFDLDQELYAPLNGLGRADANKMIQVEQFEIRFEEHAATATDLVQRIIRGARYSTATFDDTSLPSDMTATEVRARQDTTSKTRDRKVRLEQTGLLALVRKMLTVDTDVFKTPELAPDNVTVKFPQLVQDTTDSNANTISMLSQAAAISTVTKVQMAHPDWDAEQVSAEVKAINAENPLTDPNTWRPSFGESDDERDPEE